MNSLIHIFCFYGYLFNIYYCDTLYKRLGLAITENINKVLDLFLNSKDNAFPFLIFIGTI
jgi:hypothetical protein